VPEVSDCGKIECVSVAMVAPARYPERRPFDPDTFYPELAQLRAVCIAKEQNSAYRAVRESLCYLGLDRENFGTPQWSPLRELVRPMDRVVVKPNWVLQGHHVDGTWEQIITHGAVLRAVIDYVAIALQGKGRISVADGPMLSADFRLISDRSGLSAIREYVSRSAPSIEFECLDLRDMFLGTQDDVIVRRMSLGGDPRGSVKVNLGALSEFYGFRGEGRLYGADYDTREVNLHHQGFTQEYLLSATAMDADVIIDVPKLKTHQKVGVTMCLKGVVGLNCGRNWLPHRTQGTPAQGGDQFAESGSRQRVEAAVVRAFELGSLRWPAMVPPIYRVFKRAGKRVFGTSDSTVRGGGWHGNDTLWRMVLDINRALTFGAREGGVSTSPQRRRFCILDGIVGGEGTGPIHATAVPAGVVIAGRNPVAVDVVGAELMGFDHRRIPTLARAFDEHRLPLIESAENEIQIAGDVSADSIRVLRSRQHFRFAEPVGWIGHLSRESRCVI